MGAKGNRRHLKRLNTPWFYQIKRKSFTFLIKPAAGPHPKDFCLPLGHVLRDLLRLGSNQHEIDYILHQGKVSVDGKIRSESKFPVGLMDVIEIQDISKAYRVLPSSKHGLILSEITKDEAKFKLCRIENISILRGGHLQLNLHDGRNIKITVDDPKKKPNIPYKTMGTLKLALPTQKILDFFPMEKGKVALVYRGKNQGITGKISNIIKRFGYMASTTVLEQSKGEPITTAFDYTFIIGNEKPCIDLPNEN